MGCMHERRIDARPQRHESPGQQQRTTLRAEALSHANPSSGRARIAAACALAVVLGLGSTAASANPSSGDTSQAQNHSPKLEVYEHTQVRVGEETTVSVSAYDEDKDDVVRLSLEGLPAGAFVETKDEGTSHPSLTIRWKPKDNQVGTTEIVATASDGKSRSSRTASVTVVDEWTSHLMPGLQYTMWAPSTYKDLGVFQGVSGEILVASWIHRNENRGPSHGRVYLDMDVMKSSDKTRPAAFDLAVGFDLSIERNPTRKFLLPYFGLKVGGMLQQDLPKGGFMQLTPYLGTYLYADRNLFVHATVGYLLPVQGEAFDAARGIRANAGFDFSLW
jgi:hypothetical protein